ncbi:MAG TPA: methyltransferase [Rhizomicrobium sp.]|nr:methyltransferase [Rhizomicrobium sp.]
MLQGILTGQAKSFVLLVWAVLLFVYFLPSVLAFRRGHRRFFVILVLNVLLSPVQGTALHFLAPSLLVIDAGNVAGTALAALLTNLGVGWILLLAWSLLPGTPDPRLLRVQETKYYDAITALPLILWFAYGALQLRAVLAHHAALIAAGSASLFVWVQFVSLLMAALFDLLLIYLLVVRDKPIAKSRGVLPRVFGFAGTFMGVSILQLKVATLTLPMQMLAAALIGIGSLGSLLVLWRLGKSFSIMPEARKLVTGGPYALARHPLYTVEMITITGTALQFAAPWSWLIALVVVALLWIRSHFEEQVLEEAYPEYAAYRARTKRFIPGVI